MRGSRWSLPSGQRSHGDDKKVLLEHCEALSTSLRTLSAPVPLPPSEESSSNAKFSSITASLAALSAIQIPHRQPSWTSEIATCLHLIGDLSPHLITAQDYASISRFITRASSERQLVLLEPEAKKVCSLLLVFLQSRGSCCRADNMVSSSGISPSLSGPIVLHEVGCLLEVIAFIIHFFFIYR